LDLVGDRQVTGWKAEICSLQIDCSPPVAISVSVVGQPVVRTAIQEEAE
jgi:hypothetical protein